MVSEAQGRWARLRTAVNVTALLNGIGSAVASLGALGAAAAAESETEEGDLEGWTKTVSEDGDTTGIRHCYFTPPGGGPPQWHPPLVTLVGAMANRSNLMGTYRALTARDGIVYHQSNGAPVYKKSNRVAAGGSISPRQW